MQHQNPAQASSVDSSPYAQSAGEIYSFLCRALSLLPIISWPWCSLSGCKLCYALKLERFLSQQHHDVCRSGPPSIVRKPADGLKRDWLGAGIGWVEE